MVVWKLQWPPPPPGAKIKDDFFHYIIESNSKKFLGEIETPKLLLDRFEMKWASCWGYSKMISKHHRRIDICRGGGELEGTSWGNFSKKISENHEEKV